jgi:fructokinase
MTLRIGIDLGGTKIEIIALDVNAEVLLRRRVATPAGDYAATLACIARLIGEAEQTLGARGTVGVGMPGALSRLTGRVKNANSTVLNDKPFKEDLQNLLAREIRLENDANCFALSEARDGAGKGSASVFGIILGTGVGAGWVVNGKLVAGAANIAGEWGHNPLPPISQLGLLGARERTLCSLETPGPACYCGRWGCVEAWVSGPAFAADYRRSDPAAAPVSDAHDLVRRMFAGEQLACAVFDRYVDRLARSLAAVINLCDPEVIVLGGGMSGIQGLAERVCSALPAYVFSDEVATRVLINQHGDSSGVRGAAWLWEQARPILTPTAS